MPVTGSPMNSGNPLSQVQTTCPQAGSVSLAVLAGPLPCLFTLQPTTPHARVVHCAQWSLGAPPPSGCSSLSIACPPSRSSRCSAHCSSSLQRNGCAGRSLAPLLCVGAVAFPASSSKPCRVPGAVPPCLDDKQHDAWDPGCAFSLAGGKEANWPPHPHMARCQLGLILSSGRSPQSHLDDCQAPWSHDQLLCYG